MVIKLSTGLRFLAFLFIMCNVYYLVLCKSISTRTNHVLKNRKTVKFRIDSRFTAKKIIMIKESLKDWERASGGLVRLNGYVDHIPFLEVFNCGEDGIPSIYKASSFLYWPAHVISTQGNHNKHLGITMVDVGDIFIMKEDELFKSVVTHEVGHVIMGGYHSINPQDLMYPIIEKPKQIAKGDIRALKIFLGEKKF